mgnify:CR=1 FL=1
MNQTTNTNNAFAITFYFFAATKCNSKKIIVLASHRTGLLTCTDTALNVNCFEQNDCKPGTTRHWTERRKADNSTFAIGGVSVSYTHLRAHETVLDLVCRLLLEKKTQHNEQTKQLTQLTTSLTEITVHKQNNATQTN